MTKCAEVAAKIHANMCNDSGLVILEANAMAHLAIKLHGP